MEAEITCCHIGQELVLVKPSVNRFVIVDDYVKYFARSTAVQPPAGVATAGHGLADVADDQALSWTGAQEA
jgi:hypothetical protein